MPVMVDDRTLYQTDLAGLTPLHRGKVRDLYAIDDNRLLIVATDRMSAFDVVLPDPIPGKGRVLTQISLFWFERTRALVPNHLTGLPLSAAIPDAAERAALEGRSMIVQRLRALPIEAVVRGYLIGSGWREYQSSGQICGIALPPGLQQAQALPEPIFTPATKAPRGEHDENIPASAVAEIVGADAAAEIERITLAVYARGADVAARRGIIVADTKVELGCDADGTLLLADEVLTPDSSRFWPAGQWQPGRSQPSLDKQYVRDWLASPESGWDRHGGEDPPPLPEPVVERTRDRYVSAYESITGRRWG